VVPEVGRCLLPAQFLPFLGQAPLDFRGHAERTQAFHERSAEARIGPQTKDGDCEEGRNDATTVPSMNAMLDPRMLAGEDL
jgi:hypothetical protein